MPPKPVKLPADAVFELMQVADGLDQQARSWPKKHTKYGMKRWCEGMRRGLTDAAASCRRRAGRIKKALQEQQIKRDAAELKAFREGK